MKKLMNLWLLAALVCGLGLSVTSCKDDDDDNKSEEQQQQEQEERASKFWSVVGQLVSSDSYAADYEDKTFEPTYGVADAANATTRIVETNDMQTAAQRFSDLVGAAIDENTPSYTYSDPDVGTLTYTRGGTADEWASVEVSIKQVPRLRKIIYREGGEGTNASFAGKAWYRFGDVVSRTLDDGNVEYWICVRPAFSPEKKGDSHWVCLNYLPAKNVYHYTGSNELEYYLPTGIGTDKEDMQNLAEMLYAMTHPQEWYDNANTYHTDGKVWGFSGLPIFADFKKANVMYHNQYFWQKVADAWEKNEVANDAFGIDFEVLSDHLEQEGLNLLYEGYQWWFKTSWNCKLWQASYTNGTKNDEKNLHHAEYKDITKRMQDIKFDCTKMGSSTDNYIQFFDNDGKYRWVIRHATGADLNGGSQPAPTSPLQGKGVKQRYRYYDYYGGEWTKPGPDGKSGKPEVTEAPTETLETPTVGCILATDGKFYNTVSEANAHSTALALVAVVNGKKRVEKNADWNGLAIMLKETDQAQWSVEDDIDCEINPNIDDFTFSQCSGEMNGLAHTKHYAEGCNKKGHNHPAAKEAYKPALSSTYTNFSNAFVPSIGQFVLVLKSLGLTWNEQWGWGNEEWNQRNTAREQQELEKMKKYFTDAGADINTEKAYWSSTPSSLGEMLMIRFNYRDNMGHPLTTSTTRKHSVLPFIAFKYDGGATED